MRTPVGLPWVQRIDYRHLRRMCTDGDRLPESFEVWEGGARLLRQRIEAAGELVMRVQLEPRQFRDWCDEHGLAPDAGARHRFAKEAVSAVFDPGSASVETNGKREVASGSNRN